MDVWGAAMTSPHGDGDPWPDPTANFHGNNEFSTTAYQRTRRSQKVKDLGRILAFVGERGDHGATCDETEVELDLRHQTASARFTELAQLDAVVIVAERRTRTGFSAGVYVVADNVLHAIRDAESVDELRALWREHRQEWRPLYTTAAERYKAKLTARTSR